MKEMHTCIESQEFEHEVPDKSIWVTEGRGNNKYYCDGVLHTIKEEHQDYTNLGQVTESQKERHSNNGKFQLPNNLLEKQLCQE